MSKMGPASSGIAIIAGFPNVREPALTSFRNLGVEGSQVLILSARQSIAVFLVAQSLIAKIKPIPNVSVEPSA